MTGVTVVIPTHDRVALLGRALASALGQTDVELQVVVVDDGSTDGTGDFLSSVADERVECIVQHPAQGVARARNAGLARARHPHVAFLDDDDLWAPDKLRAQLAALGRVPGARWAVTGDVVVTPDLRVIGHDRPPRDPDVAGHLLQYNHIPGGCSGVLAATDLVREVGGFDPALRAMADWDLWVRLALQSPLVSVPHPLLAYVQHAGMSWQARDMRAELDRFLAKHAVAREERGLGVDLGWWYAWFAELDARAGRRAAAAQHAVRAASRRRPSALVDGLLGPLAGRARDELARRRVPPAWRAEAEGWLDRWRDASTAA